MMGRRAALSKYATFCPECDPLTRVRTGAPARVTVVSGEYQSQSSGNGATTDWRPLMAPYTRTRYTAPSNGEDRPEENAPIWYGAVPPNRVVTPAVVTVAPSCVQVVSSGEV